MSLPLPAIPSLVTSLGMGYVFGTAIEKGGVYKPSVIIGQMLLTDFSMMKMFLAAGATSLVIHSILSVVTPDAFAASRKENESRKSIRSTMVGAGLLGAGMAVCGACPGTVLVQVGTGVPNSLFVLGAGLVGALLYGLMFQRNVTPGNVGAFKAAVKAKDFNKMEQYFGVPYWQMGLATAGMLAGAVYGFEYFFPYAGPGAPGAWAPHLAGMLVGSLQLPGMLLLHRTLGSSTSYSSIASCSACAVVPSSVGPAFKAYSDRTLENWWQPVYLVGAVAGAYVSSGGFTAISGDRVSPAMAAAGGLCLLFGSRTAAGCTSGHGISGFSQLYFKSLLAVAAMFGGGIATAFTLRAYGI